MSDREASLPAPSFEFLVFTLRIQAEAQLAGPKEGGAAGSEEGPDLRLARHFIDLLAMLQEKTRGNLSLEEQRLLDNTVTELRFRYLHAFEAAQKKAAQTSAAHE
jgi:hypothetical protein